MHNWSVIGRLSVVLIVVTLTFCAEPAIAQTGKELNKTKKNRGFKTKQNEIVSNAVVKAENQEPAPEKHSEFQVKNPNAKVVLPKGQVSEAPATELKLTRKPFKEDENKSTNQLIDSVIFKSERMVEEK